MLLTERLPKQVLWGFLIPRFLCIVYDIRIVAKYYKLYCCMIEADFCFIFQYHVRSIRIGEDFRDVPRETFLMLFCLCL